MRRISIIIALLVVAFSLPAAQAWAQSSASPPAKELPDQSNAGSNSRIERGGRVRAEWRAMARRRFMARRAWMRRRLMLRRRAMMRRSMWRRYGRNSGGGWRRSDGAARHGRHWHGDSRTI